MVAERSTWALVHEAQTRDKVCTFESLKSPRTGTRTRTGNRHYQEMQYRVLYCRSPQWRDQLSIRYSMIVNVCRARAAGDSARALAARMGVQRAVQDCWVVRVRG